ncbi:hypothetical protein ZIOFF_001846 [Zingiber officinale]|uniref:Inhibitor I9 domain-containing protein n=1 Tax=Zingiber officinale TaxID=94328 RepID=A0A8J5M915_ZINOF|nr:hypothetical protein ZIOFF_001846 [Zingiber officinale]
MWLYFHLSQLAKDLWFKSRPSTRSTCQHLIKTNGYYSELPELSPPNVQKFPKLSFNYSKLLELFSNYSAETNRRRIGKLIKEGEVYNEPQTLEMGKDEVLQGTSEAIYGVEFKIFHPDLEGVYNELQTLEMGKDEVLQGTSEAIYGVEFKIFQPDLEGVYNEPQTLEMGKDEVLQVNATKHPMEPKTQLHKDLEGTPVDTMECRRIISCLRYLLHTWLDLSYSVGMASRYMERPTIMHHKVVKQILRSAIPVLPLSIYIAPSSLRLPCTILLSLLVLAMAPLRFYFFLSLLGCFCVCSISLAELRKKTYIVHMAKAQMPAAFAEHSRWYDASLRSVSDTAELLYTYDTVAHGFCARLTPAEARALEDLPGVLAVHPEVRYELHTTRTPEFLHLDRAEALLLQFNTESDVVIGVLDTGVWPERRSYDDAGLGPVPASWRGECEEGKDFTAALACNRKLVGARFFSKGYESPRSRGRHATTKAMAHTPLPPPLDQPSPVPTC